MRGKVRTAALLAALLALACAEARAAPGDLDASFGGDGRIALTAAGAFVPRAVAVDAADRILVAGYLCEPSPVTHDGTCLADGSASFRLARLTPDGGLDAEFGANGFVTTPLGDGRSQALDVLVLADGRIVAAGVGQREGRDVFALARYSPTGALDPSFGDGGVVLAPIGTTYASIGNIALGPAGSILAAGQAVDAAGRPRMAIARFTAAGALDTTFGADGVTLGGDSNYGYGVALTVTTSGDPLVAGLAGDSADPRTFRFAALRVSASGAPAAAIERRVGSSSSFATAVVATTGGGWLAAGAATIPDGHQAMAAVRARADGQLDTTFGRGGSTLVSLLDGAVANDLVVDRSGRPLLVGHAARDGTYRFATARLTPDGAPDTGYGDGGATVVAFPDYPSARATAGVLQRSGRLVTVGVGCDGGAGVKCTGGTSRLLVARQFAGEDRTAPAIRIARVARRVTRRRLRNLKLDVGLSERAWLEVSLWDGKRRLFRARPRTTSDAFSIRLHPRRRALRRTEPGRLRLTVRAADLAGNSTTRRLRLTLRG